MVTKNYREFRRTQFEQPTASGILRPVGVRFILGHGLLQHTHSALAYNRNVGKHALVVARLIQATSMTV